MEEPAFIDPNHQYRWLDYGSYNRLFVIDELWAQSLQLLPVEKIYLPLGGDSVLFQPIASRKDVDVLFLDIPSLPGNDLTTQFGRRKILGWLRGKGINPLVVRGAVAGRQLNRFYNRAKVVVYLNPLLLKTDFATVVYDVLLSGSFLLTDHKTNAEKLFDGQLVTFTDVDQLADQVRYFLYHQQEAHERANRLRSIVFNRHTMGKRREVIAQTIKELA